MTSRRMLKANWAIIVLLLFASHSLFMKAQDVNYKSIIQNLVRSAGSNGARQFSINIPVQDRNPELKRWIARNAESLEKTRGGPFDATAQYVTTYSHDHIYVHILKWNGSNNVSLPAVIDRSVKRAWLLNDGVPVRVDQSPWGLIVVVPKEQRPNDIDTIVVLQMPGNIADLAPPRTVDAKRNHFVLLQGETAKLRGGIWFNQAPDWIEGWTSMAGSITWRVRVPVAGEYSLAMTYSCAAGCSGGQFEIATANSKVIGTLQETKGMWGKWRNFEQRKVPGTIHLNAGVNQIVMRAIRKGTADEFMRLYGLYLFSPEAKNLMTSADRRAQHERIDAGWLGRAKYGLMVHWLPNTMPRHGPKKPFCQAVADFNVQRFAKMVQDTGAKYLIFTLGQLQYFPAPFKSVDAVLPNRTCKNRDLPKDLANALAHKGIKLILYYHQGVGDTAWSKAAGFLQPNKSEFFAHESAILAEGGSRYGSKLAGWWFDDRYPLQPFEKLDKAAKVGNPSRIVAFNSWILPKETNFQDYWAGEVGGELRRLPDTGYFTQGGVYGGLQPHVLIFLDDPWVHGRADTPIRPPLFRDKDLADYVTDCNRKGAAVTMNIGVYPDGTASPDTLKQLQFIRNEIRGY